ncbi:MAG: hypothetical protein OXU75_04055 [Deltaproteobacteria bacterium]|nr:hypothetical protein [Deltaproteobacteria bacterium]
MGEDIVMTRRLVELWEAPQGYRLASVVATTYELQADFLEEDLLPVALGLRLPPARGRDFRLELESALTNTEVSVFFHPGRYQPGLRRSPRIDLVPLPEGRYPKLHAKVALLRFVTPSARERANQIIRLVVTSANLTGSGYHSNIEVAASVCDAPGASPESITAVREAVDWLEGLTRPSTDQVSHQLRDMKAVFASSPAPRRNRRLRFVGLPSGIGFPPLVEPREQVDVLTIASPFWPSGGDLSDVASALRRLCGGRLGTVRLIGPAISDEQGEIRPVIPPELVRSLLNQGATVEVAAANPSYGCTTVDEDDEGEFDGVAGRRVSTSDGNRSLHAKALLAIGDTTTRLAIGSFNLSRRGLGLVSGGNAEAGLLWTLRNEECSRLADVLSFGTSWHEVTHEPEEFVVEPENYDSDNESGWPDFILSLRANRDRLIIEGNATNWPDEVVIRMRDIRSRLSNREEWFDPWTVSAPTDTDGVFSASNPLSASWLNQSRTRDSQPCPALPDLEAEVSWDGTVATLPVVFEDKHLFPVVEPRSREDEQSLVAWFLGLRAAAEVESNGFGHSIDPIRGYSEPSPATGDILSYLVRDFVHALPGIVNHLADTGLTELGLRAALFGHRSPVELARESLRAYQNPQPGKPRKTVVATAFQLTELLRLLQTVPLPALADGVADRLRDEAVAAVSSELNEVIADLPTKDCTDVVRSYLALHRKP